MTIASFARAEYPLAIHRNGQTRWCNSSNPDCRMEHECPSMLSEKHSSPKHGRRPRWNSAKAMQCLCGILCAQLRGITTQQRAVTRWRSPFIGHPDCGSHRPSRPPAVQQVVAALAAGMSQGDLNGSVTSTWGTMHCTCHQLHPALLVAKPTIPTNSRPIRIRIPKSASWNRYCGNARTAANNSTWSNGSGHRKQRGNPK